MLEFNILYLATGEADTT